MSRLAYAAIIAAGSALLASGASAETVNFSQTSGNLFGGVGPVGVHVTSATPAVSLNTNAGGFRLTGTDTTTNVSTNVIAWCVDLLDFLVLPATYSSTTAPFADGEPNGPITATTQGLIKSLFDTNYTAALVGNANASAAFQLALWELVYETSGTYSLSVGNFQTSTASLVATANTFLNNIVSGPILSSFDVTYWDSAGNPGGDRQNLVTVSEVPLPAAVWLFGSGLVGLGVLSRKRRKATSAAAA